MQTTLITNTRPLVTNTRLNWASYLPTVHLFPDWVITELIDLRDKIRGNSFRVGDIALYCVEQCAQSGVSATRQEIWDAVGQVVGYSGRTIRYFAETAAFYSPEVRDEFDVCPFTHFVYARYQGEGWRDVLVYSATHLLIGVPGLAHWWEVGRFAGQLQGEVVDTALDNQSAQDKTCEVSQSNRCGHRADIIYNLSSAVTWMDEAVQELTGENDELAQELSERSRWLREKLLDIARALSA